MGSGRWCPWCASELSAESAQSERWGCASCGGKVPASAWLPSKPGTPIHPDDPEAKLPARGPASGSPLPQGTPDPTLPQMATWAASIAAAVVLLSTLAYVFGGDLLDRAPAPTSKPTVTATPTSTPAAAPTRR